MKIVRLEAENVKRIRAVQIEPDGNTVVVAGRNGQGKTSVLDAIWMALGGKKAQPARPIRDGEQKAAVTLDLGELVVTRTWKGDSTHLRVTRAGGIGQSRPQELLDKLLGPLSFDPLAFATAAPKAQARTLAELIGLDFDEMAEDRARLYAQRTEVGRGLRDAQARLAEHPEPDADVPEEEVSAAELTAEYRKASEQRAANDAARRRLEQMESEEAQVLARVADLARQLEEAKGELQDVSEAIEKLRGEAEGLVDPDLSKLEERLAEVDSVNQAVRAKRRWSELADRVAELADEQRGLTEAIEFLDRSKQQAIEQSDMPIEGLDFDESGVSYSGVPLTQCSASERLKVSVSIAMAMNPEIRVIRITDGSLLDNESLGIVKAMADEHDCQVWIECVADSGEEPGGVIIEDGGVVDGTIVP